MIVIINLTPFACCDSMGTITLIEQGGLDVSALGTRTVRRRRTIPLLVKVMARKFLRTQGNKTNTNCDNSALRAVEDEEKKDDGKLYNNGEL